MSTFGGASTTHRCAYILVQLTLAFSMMASMRWGCITAPAIAHSCKCGAAPTLRWLSCTNARRPRARRFIRLILMTRCARARQWPQVATARRDCRLRWMLPGFMALRASCGRCDCACGLGASAIQWRIRPDHRLSFVLACLCRLWRIREPKRSRCDLDLVGDLRKQNLMASNRVCCMRGHRRSAIIT